MHAGRVVECLRNQHPARKNGDIGNETNVAEKLIALGPGVAAENLELSLIFSEAENRIECGALSRTIGADQSKDPSLFDAQIDAVECDGFAEGLAQAACFDDGHGFFVSFVAL